MAQGTKMNIYDLVKRLLDRLDGSVEIFNITIGNDIILVHTLDNKIITFPKQSKTEPRVRIELNNGHMEYYCGRCGNKISNDDIYCSKCGIVLYRKIEKM